MNLNFEHPLVPMAGRLLMSYIYLTSGIAKVFSWNVNAAYMERHHVPVVPVLLLLATIIELGGSICLITGFQARWAALIMCVYTLALTMFLHNYWAYSGDAAGVQETHFRKNMAIMGGLLALAYGGPGHWALRWPPKSTSTPVESSS